MAVERISPQAARQHMEANPQTLLVCAYDDQDKFRKNRLERAISLDQFRALAPAIPKDREVIFYCA